MLWLHHLAIVSSTSHPWFNESGLGAFRYLNQLDLRTFS